MDKVTREEAAQSLGVNIRTIDSFLKRGLLTKYTRPGTDLVRVSKKEIENFWVANPKEEK